MPFLKINKDVKLFYTISGQGLPLIFLHGWTSNHWMWIEQEKYFSKNYQVIIPDLKGHGESDKPKANYLMAEFAAELNQFINTLLGSKNYILIGHSMGGMIALSYAINPKYTANLKALVPCSTTYKMSNPVLSQLVDKLKQGILKYDYSLQEMMSKLAYYGKFAREHRDIIKKNAEEGMKCPAHVAIACLDAFVNKYNIEKNLSAIKVPTLIMTGDKDSMIDPINSETMQTLIPKITMKVLGPNAGHCIQLEKIEEFNQTLESFIKTVK